ncbi:MAG: hypothetical protein DWQ06_14620 [Calditrichaeota bacterium]|nr:MAG: hypothetical protein DWQ06_14620 [Calditrichota bacterium]
MKQSLLCSFFIFVAGISYSQETTGIDFQENFEIQISKATDKIHIDGKVAENSWQNAQKLTDFYEIEPGDNTQPNSKTEAFLTYDDKNFYFAFTCYEENMSELRSTITTRDGIFQDDFVGIMLDTFGDEQNAYEFFVNPNGIQGDLKRTGNNEDSSFDTIWESEGRIGKNSWSVEVAIPFKSIRFPNSIDSDWRIHVFRVRPRSSREQISLVKAEKGNDCFLCTAAYVKGMEKIEVGKNLEILPYVIGSQSNYLSDDEDPNSKFKNDKPDAAFGIDLKYGITPNLTLDFTANPDFSQIESDEAQIDVNSSFALFFPERRPFFLEGSEIFQTHTNIVYTRSINDPSVAGKLTGKNGDISYGYIFAKDGKTPFILPFEESSEVLETEEDSYSNILRVKKDLSNDSYIGLIGTNRTLASDGSNSTFGADATFRLSKKYKLNLLFTGSYTKEPNDTSLTNDIDSLTFDDGKYNSIFDGEDFLGTAFKVNLQRSSKGLNFFLWYDDYSPTFRASDGFITSNNFRMGGIWTGYSIYSPHKFIDYIEPQIEIGRKYNYDGKFKDWWVNPHLFIRFKRQTTFFVGYVDSKERYGNVLVKGIRRVNFDLETRFSQMISGGVEYLLGTTIVRNPDDYDFEKPFLGFERNFEIWTTLKPTRQLICEFNYDHYNLKTSRNGKELEDGYILRNKLTYQFTKNLSLRLITQYDSFEEEIQIDPLLSYKINPFSLFYIGSTHLAEDFGGKEGFIETNRQFFVKLQYLFRI